MRKQDRICGQLYAHAADLGVLTYACIYIPEIILEAEVIRRRCCKSGANGLNLRL